MGVQDDACVSQEAHRIGGYKLDESEAEVGNGKGTALKLDPLFSPKQLS